MHLKNTFSIALQSDTLNSPLFASLRRPFRYLLLDGFPMWIFRAQYEESATVYGYVNTEPKQNLGFAGVRFLNLYFEAT